MTALFPFIFLILIAAFYFLLGVFPTVVNILISIYFVRTLKAKFSVNKYQSIALFIAISVLTTINIRLPSIIYDLSSIVIDPNINKIHKKITIPINTRINYVANEETIHYREHYLETTDLTSASIGPPSYHHPYARTFNLESWFITRGILISPDATSNIKLEININKTESHEQIEINIYKNNKLKSQLKHKFRTKFPGETSDKSLVNFLIFTSQNNLTNSILSGELISSLKFRDAHNRYKNKQNLIDEFLSKAISISAPPPDVKTVDLIATHKESIPDNTLVENIGNV